MLGDESARAVERIHNVKALRLAQFAEDAGPMAHPIRPDSYQEIDNFYTSTVYEKGAEVIRMLQTLLGKDTFRKGFDLYIARNDGHAVTCEAFLEAMEEASGRDLQQFRRWYSQAGTPRVAVSTQWNAEAGQLVMTVEQTTPPTPGQPAKESMLMPFPVALLDAEGREMPVLLKGESEGSAQLTRMFELKDARQTWVFSGLREKPVPSLNRGFAAPVILDVSLDADALALLARADSDPFNRWEAMNRLMMKAILEQVRAVLANDQAPVNATLLEAFGAIIDDVNLSPAFRAVAMELPSERAVADAMPIIDPAVRAKSSAKPSASAGTASS